MNPPELRIWHLYISPGHNFFGHHGREPSAHGAIEVEEMHCVAGRGVEGDRFFNYKPDYKGQITFFAWEVYEELLDMAGVEARPPSVLRRNVIVEGLSDLNQLVGHEFALQGVRFQGTQHCAPCYWMDRAFAPGTEHALQKRGGLRARILSDGILRREREGAHSAGDMRSLPLNTPPPSLSEESTCT